MRRRRASEKKFNKNATHSAKDSEVRDTLETRYIKIGYEFK